MVAAAPVSATGFHSSPVLGSTFQFVRNGSPMTFCICGLTVVGTGTDFAGTSRTNGAGAWAIAAEPHIAVVAAMLARPNQRRLAISE